MSLAAILAAIESSGEAEAAQLRSEAEARARQILADAERQAAARRETARRAALQPAARETARRLHRAKLEALCALGEVRDGLIERALSAVSDGLGRLRADAAYPLALRRLTEEAINLLGDEGADGQRCLLEVDPRDEALLQRILGDLGLNLTVIPALTAWGGVVARSSDGRIAAINTLEARLERAKPLLRRDLAAFFEKVEAARPAETAAA